MWFTIRINLLGRQSGQWWYMVYSKEAYQYWYFICTESALLSLRTESDADLAFMNRHNSDTLSYQLNLLFCCIGVRLLCDQVVRHWCFACSVQSARFSRLDRAVLIPRSQALMGPLWLSIVLAVWTEAWGMMSAAHLSATSSKAWKQSIPCVFLNTVFVSGYFVTSAIILPYFVSFPCVFPKLA